jgi:hypothetical protein
MIDTDEIEAKSMIQAKKATRTKREATIGLNWLRRASSGAIVAQHVLSLVSVWRGFMMQDGDTGFRLKKVKSFENRSSLIDQNMF